MATRKQKIKVSLFLLACATISVVATMVISGIYKEPGEHYWIEFDESILGLYEGGMVEYLGVPVGKVRDIFVTPNQRAHVEMVVNPEKVTLHQGVEGRLVLFSLAAGTMAISLSGGDKTLPELPENSQIMAQKSTIEAVSSQITDIMEQASQIATKINRELSHIEDGDVKEIVDHVKGLIEKGKGLVDQGSEMLTEVTGAVKELRGESKRVVDALVNRSQDLERVAREMEQLLSTANEKVKVVDVEGTQQNLNEMMTNISELAGRVQKTVEEMNTVAANVTHEADNMEYNLRATMNELRDAFESMRLLVDALQQDPSQLVRGKASVKSVGPNK